MTTKKDDDKPKNLYQKLVEIMSEMGRVEKKGYNAFHKYSYVTESDLTDALRDKLAVRNIIIIPSLMDVQHDDSTLTTITMSFTLVNADDPSETHEIKWAGTGDDKGDKGLYKAYTGALKYFLMKTFLVSQGDDPEGDTKTDQRAENKSTQVDGVRCPECNGAMWDNRDSKRNPRAPDYKCKTQTCNGAVWEDSLKDAPPAEADAGVNALRTKIKEAMTALNDLGDVPEWTVQRVNEMAKLHFNDVAAKLGIEPLGQLAAMLSERLEALRKPAKGSSRDNILASIKASSGDKEIAEYLIENCDGKDLEELTDAELNEMDKKMGVPF